MVFSSCHHIAFAIGYCKVVDNNTSIARFFFSFDEAYLLAIFNDYLTFYRKIIGSCQIIFSLIGVFLLLENIIPFFRERTIWSLEESCYYRRVDTFFGK